VDFPADTAQNRSLAAAAAQGGRPIVAHPVLRERPAPARAPAVSACNEDRSKERAFSPAPLAQAERKEGHSSPMRQPPRHVRRSRLAPEPVQAERQPGERGPFSATAVNKASRKVPSWLFGSPGQSVSTLEISLNTTLARPETACKEKACLRGLKNGAAKSRSPHRISLLSPHKLRILHEHRCLPSYSGCSPRARP